MGNPWLLRDRVRRGPDSAEATNSVFQVTLKGRNTAGY